MSWPPIVNASPSIATATAVQLRRIRTLARDLARELERPSYQDATGAWIVARGIERELDAARCRAVISR
jgi:hypothetical protein